MPEQDVGSLNNKMAARIVLGKPLTVRDTTLVPVISVTAGFGKLPNTTGGGGGFTLNPVAVVALHNDSLQVYSLQRQCSVEQLSSILDKPELKNDHYN